MPDSEDNLTPEDLMVATALSTHRPAPAPAFRGALTRRLAALDPGYGHRPARLRTHAALLCLAGAILLLLGLLVGTGAI
ncbi:MAG: hypothetical protein M0T77_01700 [Actinomycetota bacterium]|nr:hypothetical protein [Actinomycetota bacterium]